MDTGVQQLLGLIFFILPGYVGLYAHDLIIPAPARSTFRAMLWSLLLSAAGALVATQWVSPAYLAHLFGTPTLSATALVGTGAQALSLIAVGGWFALLKKYGLKGRLGRRSIYPTAWDALWSEHGGERRYVVVEVPGRHYAGTLTYADDPRIGRALVLKNSSQWDPAKGRYAPLGAEFSYFPADQVRRIDLSRAASLEKDERTNEQVQGPAGTRQLTSAGDKETDDGATAQGAARRIPRAIRSAGGDNAEQLH